jgi:hypothetical protein
VASNLSSVATRLRRWKRRTECRLRGGARTRIVHGTHHKTGTRWTLGILAEMADRFGWRCQDGEQDLLRWDTEVFLQNHSRIDLSLFSQDVRGTHVIRDPRDVVLSGYHFHLRSSEAWLHQPRREFGGRTYQQHLRALSPRDGLVAEMRRCADDSVGDMLRWNYSDPRILELKYETLMSRPEETFRAMFRHYGLSDEQTAIALEIALEHTIPTSRRGIASDHIRSGRIEQWREAYDADLIAAYTEILGDAHTRLGYPAW